MSVYTFNDGNDDGSLFMVGEDDKDTSADVIERFTKSFSAISSSILPSDLLDKPEICELYDEFGFLIVNEENKENTDEGRRSSIMCESIRSPEASLIEDPRNRLQWIAYMEFTYNKDVEEMTWDRLVFRLVGNSRLDRLMENGIPHSMRAAVWLRLSGALVKREEAGVTYEELARASSSNSLLVTRQIEKDLLRTLPGNACFSSVSSPGVGRLRRVLRALAYYYPDIGYCQGMGLICAELLLFLEEEDTFWLMCAVLENYLPATYYSGTLIGARADQRALLQLIADTLPEIDSLLAERDIELSLITLAWFMCIFIGALPPAQLLQLWDWFLYEGVIALFRLTLALLQLAQADLVSAPNTAVIFSRLADLPRNFFLKSCKDKQQPLTIIALLARGKELLPDENKSKLDALRRSCQAELMSDQGIIISSRHSGNLPRQQLTRRSPPKGSAGNAAASLLSSINPFHRSQQDHATPADGAIVPSQTSHLTPAEDSRAKNIRQTELLVALREAILQVTRHFSEKGPSDAKEGGELGNGVAPLTLSPLKGHHNAADDFVPQMRNSVPSSSTSSGSSTDNRGKVAINGIDMSVDYSPESHAHDLERFLAAASGEDCSNVRRAIALVDFERQDDDELGFRKNDVISLLATRDEHCWIGEIRGLRGWFPARFVRILDERGGTPYNPAGDDTVDQAIADLVRGLLAPAIRSILTFGMKKKSLIVGYPHPWQFIEEVITKSIATETPAVAPRLVLAQTFSLEDDGRVLTPDELLVKHFTAINISHDAASAPLDTRLRSLICCGLNEQCLHLWLESWCTAQDVVRRYYESWSFVRSPAWIQIKCDMRILARLCFHLSRDWELPARDNAYRDFKNGVRDLLVKHHLFSWEL